MKAFFLLTLTILLLGCKAETNIEVLTPSLAKINGNWQLYKTNIGYPMPNGPTEIKIENTDILSFDASKKTYIRTVNGKVTESSPFDIKAVSYNGSKAKEAIVFEKEQKYSYLTFDDENLAIILYQSTPIGAELADGNSYYYQKVK